MPVQYINVLDGNRVGKVIGASNCPTKGCTGLRISVRWSDGKHTRPCSHEHLTKVMGTEGDWRVRFNPVAPH